MSVIIQEMIAPEISGVSFSRHPIAGLDEVIVEAVKGTGDRLVQDGIDPLRWAWKAEAIHHRSALPSRLCSTFPEPSLSC